MIRIEGIPIVAARLAASAQTAQRLRSQNLLNRVRALLAA
jgi:hypothetical protein